jgi:hypothetical protein
MAIRWAHPKYFATSEQAWMAIRWAHPRFAKQRTRVDGHTVGTFKPFAIYLTSGDGHTVGPSQTHCNLKQGWMATRWAHPTYFAYFDRSPAKQFTRLGGHTVGTSQLLCTFETIIDHTVGQCLGMVSDVISKTTAQDNNACDCRQGWIATRWAHPRM